MHPTRPERNETVHNYLLLLKVNIREDAGVCSVHIAKTLNEGIENLFTFLCVPLSSTAKALWTSFLSKQKIV